METKTIDNTIEENKDKKVLNPPASNIVYVRGVGQPLDGDHSEIIENKNNTGVNFRLSEHGTNIDPEINHNRTFSAFNSADKNENHQRKVVDDFDLTRAPRWLFIDEDLPNFPEKTKNLRVLVISWNMFGKKPQNCLKQLINAERCQHHLIAIGTEECWRSIQASVFYESKSPWTNMIRNYLEKDYIMIKAHSLNAMHLVLFAHKSIYNHISKIESSDVPTGIGNVVGNKGGIGICFNLYGRSYLFINCHLSCKTTGNSQVPRRNKDFERIYRELDLPKMRKVNIKSMVYDRFDYVFWSGDFNYRVNVPNETAIKLIKENKFEDLLLEEQLLKEMKSNTIFTGFQEGKLKFAPSYKFEVGTCTFDTSKKKRAPSWTDRILNNRKKSEIVQVNYDSNNKLIFSDHKPVFSQFYVAIDEIDEDDTTGFIKAKSSNCQIF